MPTPGMIATDMQIALRDLEATLGRLAAALGVMPYATPQVRHHDRAYVDMVRTRALAGWLAEVVTLVESLAEVIKVVEAAQSTDLRPALGTVLQKLTKAQLLDLAVDFALDGLSDSQLKDELVEALAAAILAPEPEA